MRSHSDLRRTGATSFFALTVVALLAVASPIFSSLVTTNIFVVSADEPVNEDVYVTSTRGIVEGTINGDLTIFTGDLYVGGTVTGSVHVFSSGTVTVAEGATIGGSIRGAAVNVEVFGDVADDLFVTAASVVVEESGVIGRDVMAFGGVVRVEGTVGRDVRGRTARTVIDGTVGGDIDVATQKFEVGHGAVIGGDVQYRSPSDGSIASGAQIAGSVKRLPTQSNFIYGVILALANVIGFLGFIVAGLLALFMARGSGSRATGAVITNPIKTFLWGVGAVIVTPVVTVVVAATLVGLPLALMMVMVMVAGLIIGPIPAVTALGNRVLIKRGGLFGAFVVGAILWRLSIWLVPIVGGVLFVLALVWGVGAWIVGIVAARNADPLPMSLMPASMIPDSGVPDDWEPPFAPQTEDHNPQTVPLSRGTGESASQGDEGAERDLSRVTEEERSDDSGGSREPEATDLGPEAEDPRPETETAQTPLEKPLPLVDPDEAAPLGENQEPEPVDDAGRRRAEFDALLAKALNDADDEGASASDASDDADDDEWGLPTS